MFNVKKKKKNIDFTEEQVIKNSFNNGGENQGEERNNKSGGNNPENITIGNDSGNIELAEKIEKYQDPEGLTLKKMALGLWLIKHKKELLAIPVAILIVVAVVTWLYSLYNIGHYVFVGMKQDRQLAEDLSRTQLVGHDYFLKIAAKDLRVLQVQAFAVDQKAYDFAAAVENINQKHAGRFTYVFKESNNETETLEAFIMPGEKKYILALNQNMPHEPQRPVFVIKNMRWIRINAHDYPDWEEFYRDHNDIKTENIEFLPAKSTVLTEKMNLNELNFDIINNTAYNYHSVGAVIVLKSTDAVAGVNRINVNNLMSGQKRDIKLTWPGRLGRIDDILIFPEVDYLSKNSYIDFSGPEDAQSD